MTQPHTRGILKIERRDAIGSLDRAKLMAKGLDDSASLFPDPNPALSVFNDQIAATDAAQVVARRGGKGAAAARDLQLGLLVGMMTSELVYIQSIADAGNPDEAVATLYAGGVEIAASTRHDKAILSVAQGPEAGSVVLTANARVLLGDRRWRKHFFHWEHTLDGATFLALPSTPASKTTLAGLTPLTTVGFRVAVTTTKGVTSAWSQVVAFLVH
jgi:hypothetical protein